MYDRSTLCSLFYFLKQPYKSTPGCNMVAYYGEYCNLFSFYGQKLQVWKNKLIFYRRMSTMRQTQKTEKKDNRKSILLIALLLLLVAIIGFGGYTLSKYITSKQETGSAQVAKWGFTIEAESSKLFGDDYKFATSASEVTEEAADLTVSASGDYNVVAPGTTGTMTFSIKGQAEVLAGIEMKMTGVKDVVLNYTVGEDATVKTYNPVKWTLTKKTATGTTTLVDGKTLADVETALNEQYAAGNKTEANTEISDEYTLTWAWAFEAGTNEDEKALTDNLDTLLGMIANNNATVANGNYKVAADTNTTIAFTLDIKVVQLAK